MKIKYFAWIKDITKKDYELIEKDFPRNINELKKNLNTMYPDLEKHIMSDILRFAINKEYVSENSEIKSTDEIAIFPPVSGG
jgi:MoaD family protein|tara:strand:+ start:148 stop:393 length:246 start_codon:yes stop_codon:yes gene_type:complete